MNIEKNVPLASRTTVGVGGNASYFACVKTEDDLREAYAYAREHALRTVILGGGSNVLVADEGIEALVIHPEFSDILFEEYDGHALLTAGAGVVFDELVARSVEEGLWGLENLSGIPGSVGAVPIQNVGAYGVEAQSVVHAVTTYNPATDTFLTMHADACEFGYRDSIFKHEKGRGLVVTRVTFRLVRTPEPKIQYKDLALAFQGTPQPTLAEIRRAVLTIRNGKFPDWRVIGTAGSFFKNPIISELLFTELRTQYPDMPGFPHNGSVKVPLGWILDKVLNVRGYREGAIGLYDKQALVLVNYGGATSEAIMAFSDAIIQKIFDATKIKVEREVVSLQ